MTIQGYSGVRRALRNAKDYIHVIISGFRASPHSHFACRVMGIVPFIIPNQIRDPEEDRKNKPSSPMPASRISVDSAADMRWRSGSAVIKWDGRRKYSQPSSCCFRNLWRFRGDQICHMQDGRHRISSPANFTTHLLPGYWHYFYGLRLFVLKLLGDGIQYVSAEAISLNITAYALTESTETRSMLASLYDGTGTVEVLGYGTPAVERSLEHHSSGRPGAILADSPVQNDPISKYIIGGSFRAVAGFFVKFGILLPAQRIITRKKSSAEQTYRQLHGILQCVGNDRIGY
ncbi:hypothetical protein F4604DRAFT_1903808 [Suillus subluteus]|nr:hypothetical protein F4604DRAFT_1903808 [Suillus subluteus]